jgi:ADP-ribose pyrophosphatase YjhB (NUDIX family)
MSKMKILFIFQLKLSKDKMKDSTKENRQLLLENLEKWRMSKEKKEEGGLIEAERRFLEAWEKMSFTAHHSTQYIDDIKAKGSLMSIQQRELSGDFVKDRHTVGLDRQKYVYFSLGVGGKRDIPIFVSDCSTEIILPLHCFNQIKPRHPELAALVAKHAELVEKIWMGNHETWFASDACMDPIEINGVTRRVKFNAKNYTKTYDYKKSTGESWQRVMHAEEEIFCAGKNTTQLMEILGLQFLLELYQFGGKLAEKILSDPEKNKPLIIKLFHQLFPSEIYPELRIEGVIPINLPGISILDFDKDGKKDSKQNVQLDDAIQENNLEKIKLALDGGALIDAPTKILQYRGTADEETVMVTPVTHAFKVGAYKAGFYLIERGARIQTISQTHPETPLTMLIDTYEEPCSLYSSFGTADPVTLIEHICRCLEGFSSDTLPEVRQFFDLSRCPDKRKSAIIARLLRISMINPDDFEELAKKKSALRVSLKKYVKEYDDIGIIASVYFFGNTEELALFTMLHEQGCDINRPEQNTQRTLAMMATATGNLDVLNWACDAPRSATIYPPTHPLSPFIAAIDSCKPEVFEWLLTKYPLTDFSDEDNQKVALILKQAKMKYYHNWQEADLEKIETIFTKNEKSREIFERTIFYEKLDYAVGGVVIATVKGEKYTLLVGKSENKWFRHKVGTYCGPGGLVERSEDFQTALLREIDEETGLKINEKEIKATKVTYDDQDKEASIDFHRELFLVDLGILENLPEISPKDDVVDAVWVPLSALSSAHYKGEPILKSNILMIQYVTDEKSYSPDAIKKALYCENTKGKAKFEELVSADQVEAVKKMIFEGVQILETDAIKLAAEKESKNMVDVLLKSIKDMNQINKKGYTPLIDVYVASEDCQWAQKIIAEYSADWRTCVAPERSLITSIFSNKDYEFLVELINRKDELRDDLFAYIFKECVSEDQFPILDLLISNYPIQSKKQLKNDEVFLKTVGDLDIFENILKRGGVASESILLNINKELENAKLALEVEAEEMYLGGLYKAPAFEQEFNKEQEAEKVEHYSAVLKLLEKYSSKSVSDEKFSVPLRASGLSKKPIDDKESERLRDDSSVDYSVSAILARFGIQGTTPTDRTCAESEYDDQYLDQEESTP